MNFFEIVGVIAVFGLTIFFFVFVATPLTVGFANAISIARFSYRNAKHRGSTAKLKWRLLPADILRNTFAYYGYKKSEGRKITITSQKTGDWWEGIGDYTVGNVHIKKR